MKMSDAKTLFVFRHGETDWNKEGRMQGGTDIPLNETGRRQAGVLAEFFKKNPVEVFLTSDLMRAHDTARIARGETDIPLVIDPRLRETNLGQAEGLLFDEVEARFGKALLDLWRHSGQEHRHVRFPGGESKHEHLTRVLDGLESFLHSTTHRRIGVAVHGGVMRRLIHHIRPDLTAPVVVANCVTYKVEYLQAKRLWHVELEPVCKG